MSFTEAPPSSFSSSSSLTTQTTTTTASTTTRTPTLPTPTERFLASNRNYIVGATVGAHVGHYQFLTRVHHAKVTTAPTTAMRSMFGLTGLGWAAAYVAVLTATTMADHAVHRSSCPIEADRRR